jgi:hypothetical protein
MSVAAYITKSNRDKKKKSLADAVESAASHIRTPKRVKVKKEEGKRSQSDERVGINYVCEDGRKLV